MRVCFVFCVCLCCSQSLPSRKPARSAPEPETGPEASYMWFAAYCGPRQCESKPRCRQCAFSALGAFRAPGNVGFAVRFASLWLIACCKSMHFVRGQFSVWS